MTGIGNERDCVPRSKKGQFRRSSGKHKSEQTRLLTGQVVRFDVVLVAGAPAMEAFARAPDPSGSVVGAGGRELHGRVSGAAGNVVQQILAADQTNIQFS